MASIQTSIELQDQFTSVIYGIINSVNTAVSVVEDMQQTMETDVDTSAFEGMRNEINQATMALDELNAEMQNIGGNGQVINMDVQPTIPDPLVENPNPVPLEVQPNAPPDIGNDISRTIAHITEQLDGVIAMQQQIDQTAASIDVLPTEVTKDIKKTNTLVEQLQAILEFAFNKLFELDIHTT